MLLFHNYLERVFSYFHEVYSVKSHVKFVLILTFCRVYLAAFHVIPFKKLAKSFIALSDSGKIIVLLVAK